MYFSIKLALRGHLDSTEKIEIYGGNYFTPEIVSMVYLCENIGEAAPQIALSMTFLINNLSCHRLHTYYTIFGVEIPATSVSLFFSVGSLLIGTIKGVVTLNKFVRKDTEFKEIFNNTNMVNKELKDKRSR